MAIASVFVEACLKTDKLKNQLKDLQNQNKAFGLDAVIKPKLDLTEFNNQIRQLNQTASIKVKLDLNQLNSEIKLSINSFSENQANNIVAAINNLENTVRDVNKQPGFIQQAISAPFKAVTGGLDKVFQGSLEQFGVKVTNQITQGLKVSLSQVIGDPSRLISGIFQNIGQELVFSLSSNERQTLENLTLALRDVSKEQLRLEAAGVKGQNLTNQKALMAAGVRQLQSDVINIQENKPALEARRLALAAEEDALSSFKDKLTKSYLNALDEAVMGISAPELTNKIKQLKSETNKKIITADKELLRNQLQAQLDANKENLKSADIAVRMQAQVVEKQLLTKLFEIDAEYITPENLDRAKKELASLQTEFSKLFTVNFAANRELIKKLNGELINLKSALQNVDPGSEAFNQIQNQITAVNSQLSGLFSSAAEKLLKDTQQELADAIASGASRSEINILTNKLQSYERQFEAISDNINNQYKDFFDALSTNTVNFQRDLAEFQSQIQPLADIEILNNLKAVGLTLKEVASLSAQTVQLQLPGADASKSLSKRNQATLPGLLPVLESMAKISGTDIRNIELPEIKLGTQEDLKGASAAYSSNRNMLLLSEKIINALKTGSFENLNDKELGTLIHELRHGFQHGFGKSIEPLALNKYLRASNDLISEIAPLVESSARFNANPGDTVQNINARRQREIDAYVFDRTQTESVKTDLKRQAILNEFGFGGGAAVKELFDVVASERKDIVGLIKEVAAIDNTLDIDALQTKLKNLPQLFDLYRQKLAELFTDFDDRQSLESLNEFQTKLENVRDLFLNTLKSTTDNIRNELITRKNTYTPTLPKTQQPRVSKSELGSDLTSKGLRTVANKLGFQNLSNKTKDELIALIQTKTEEEIQSVIDSLDKSIFKKSSSKYNEAFELKPQTIDVREYLREDIRKLKEALQNNEVDLIKRQAEAINNIIAELSKANLSSDSSKVLAGYKSIINETLRSINQSDFETQFDDLDLAFGDIFNWLKDLKEELSNTSQVSFDYARQVSENFIKSIEDNLQLIDDLVNNRIKTKKVVFDPSGDPLAQSFQNQAQYLDKYDKAVNEYERRITNMEEGKSDPLVNFFEGIRNGFSNINEFVSNNPLIQTIKDYFAKIGGLAIPVGIFLVFKDQLDDFVRSSQAAFREFETIKRAITFGVGSDQLGDTFFTKLSKQAQQLGLDIRSAAEGAAQFLPATIGTALEGEAGRDTLENLQQFFAVRAGSREATQRAFAAIIQSASKGQLYREELVGQLAESAPGAIGIFARSQGLDQQAFLNKVSQGGIGAESLIGFAQQAALESSVGLEKAQNSVTASINRANNALLQLQLTVGQNTIGLNKFTNELKALGLGFINDNLGAIVKTLGTLTLTLAAPGLKLVGSLFKSLATSLIAFLGKQAAFQGFVGQLKAMTSAGMLANLKSFAKWFILIEIGITTIDKLGIAFKDLSGNIGEFAKSAEKGIAQLQKINDIEIKPKKTDISEFEKSYIRIMRGFDVGVLARGFMGQTDKDEDLQRIYANNKGAFLNPFDNTFEKRVKELYDSRQAFDSLINSTKQLATESANIKYSDAIAQVNILDKQLADIQERRRAISILDPQNTEAYKELGKQESEIVKRRYEALKPAGMLQGELKSQIQSLEKVKETLQEQFDSALIGQEEFTQKTEVANSRLKELETIQERISKQVGSTSNAFDLLKRQIIDSKNDLTDLVSQFDLLQKKAQINLLSSDLTTGNQDFAQQLSQLTQLEAKVRAEASTVKIQESFFNFNEVAQRTLKAFGVNAQTGVAKIREIAERTDNEQSKFLLESYADFRESQSNLLDTQISALDLRKQIRESIKQNIIQVRDFFESVVSQLNDARLEYKKALNQVKRNQEVNKIREAVAGTDNEFITAFADMLISQIETSSDAAQAALDEQTARLANAREFDATLRSAQDLSKVLPGKIEIELDYTNVDALISGFNQAVKLNDDLNESNEKFNDLIDQNITGFKDTNEQLEKTKALFDDILDLNKELNSQLDDTASNIGNIRISFNDVATAIASASVNAANFAATVATADPRGLINTENVQQALNTVGQIGTNPQGFVNSLQQGITNAVGNLSRGLNNLFGSSSKLYASPSAKQSWEQVLKGSVSPMQSFSAPRNRRGRIGRHNGIDFDSTEGLTSGDVFRAMFPGVVKTMDAWRGGTTDKVTGRPSNAIRVESQLPGMNKSFFVDYGHVDMTSTKGLKAGAAIQSGQNLGRLSVNDQWSSGGHLDLKIKIPNEIKGQFKHTRSAGEGYSFVDVKEFMKWYQQRADKMSQIKSQTSSQVVVDSKTVTPKTTQQLLQPLNGSTNNQPKQRTLGGAIKESVQNLFTNPGQLLRDAKEGAGLTIQDIKKFFRSSNAFEGAYGSDQGLTPLNSITRGGNELTPQEQAKLTDLGKRLYELRNNKYILALSDAVARAEGTDFRGNSKNFGYGMLIGGENITNFSGHPFVEGGRRYRHNSSASGRYQMMDFNYSKSRVQRQFGRGARTDLEAVINYGGKDNPGTFSPGLQDLYFIASLKKRGVLDQVLKGNIDSNVLNKLAPHYASIQSGSRRSAYAGQGTPQGRHANFISFVQKRLQERPGTQETTSVPTANVTQQQVNLQQQNLQTILAQGTAIAQQTRQQKDQNAALQTEAVNRENAFKTRMEEFKVQQKAQEQELKNKKTIIDSEHAITDALNDSIIIKTRSQEFDIERQQIQRKILEEAQRINEEVLSLDRAIQAGELIKQTQQLTSEQQKQLDIQLADLAKVKEIKLQEQEKLKLAYETTIQRKEELFARQQILFAAKQQLDFESQLLNKSQAQVSLLEARKQIDPGRSGVDIVQQQTINELEQQRIQYQQSLVALQERRLSDGDYTLQQYLKDIQLLNTTNDLTRERIQLLGEFNAKQTAINDDKASLDRQRQLEDFGNNPSFEARRMSLENYRGNPFIKNRGLRTLESEQEAIRYKRQLEDLDIQVREMELLTGKKIPDNVLTQVKEDLAAINQMNLEGINQKFKTFGDNLNQIGYDLTMGLSQGITDLIMGTSSLENVLDNFFNSILSQTLNVGLNSLLGGLFGGLFYKGGIVKGYAGGGMVENYPMGGKIPYYGKGGKIPNYAIGEALVRERKESGRQPQLAVVHAGELIIPAERAEMLSRTGLTPEMLLGKNITNYATGGVVGGVSSVPSRELNMKVEYTKIGDVNYVTVEQFDEGVRKAARQGTEGGYNKTMNSLRNDVNMRRNIGI